VAAVALVAGVAWALLGSSLLVVRSVRTTGARDIPRARVLAAAGIKLGTPLIRIDSSIIAKRVERITRVQVARVTRSWPDAVVIWTKQRTAVFAVADHGGYDRMDQFGVLLGHTATPSARLVIWRSASGPATGLRGSQAVRAAGRIVLGLPHWLRGRVAAAKATGPADVTLTLHDGATIRWGGPGRAAAKAREMSVLLRTDAKYYDVSDPTTAVTGSSAPGSG
jgi:cell division protein FtsQ